MMTIPIQHQTLWLTIAFLSDIAECHIGIYICQRLLVRSIGIEKVRFYVVGDNLWTWSKRQGLDSTSKYYW